MITKSIRVSKEENVLLKAAAEAAYLPESALIKKKHGFKLTSEL